MTPDTHSLNALTCVTLQAPELSATRGEGAEAAPVQAPLADKVSFHVDDPLLQEQVATTLQLIAASQGLIHPWMSLHGLYRLIVAPDRQAAVVANRDLIEAIGQTVAMYQGKTSAFAFPCMHGIVVVMPLDIVRFAVAPENEAERQYGLTTIWHELAHVHALHLQFFRDGAFQAQSEVALAGWVHQVWHEFFADRHSHWPGFSTGLEQHLLVSAWQEFLASPTRQTRQHLLVRMASAYGRVQANPQGVERFEAFLEQALGVPVDWSPCANALDSAAIYLRETGKHPDLRPIETAFNTLLASDAFIHALSQ